MPLNENLYEEKYRVQVELWLSKKVMSFLPLSGGKNSRVLKVTCDDENEYVLKHYFEADFVERNRLRNEFEAFQLMDTYGVDQCPKALFYNGEEGLALYSYIDGEKVSAQSLGDDAIKPLLAFIHEMSTKIPHGVFPYPAADACISPVSIVEQIEFRLLRLNKQSAPATEELFQALTDFIDNSFIPKFKQATDDAKTLLVEQGISFTDPTPDQELILSPSDFGYHNALYTNERFHFFDFEYFGFDDPVKLVADVLLHPNDQMNIDKRLGKIFKEAVFDNCTNSKHAEIRFKALFPLIKLKWCMILLNEFLKNRHDQIAFVNDSDSLISQIQACQLEKAIKLMDFEWYSDN